MAVEHIVLFEPKDDATDEQVRAAMDAIRELKGKIPGILDLKMGDNFTDRAPNVKQAAIVTLESKEALAGYGPHPEHQKVLALLNIAMSGWTVVDFET